ncbi:hypothetical protein BCV71DRAFT_280448, partial [Rhizopus microsporus]
LIQKQRNYSFLSFYTCYISDSLNTRQPKQIRSSPPLDCLHLISSVIRFVVAAYFPFILEPKEPFPNAMIRFRGGKEGKPPGGKSTCLLLFGFWFLASTVLVLPHFLLLSKSLLTIS